MDDNSLLLTLNRISSYENASKQLLEKSFSREDLVDASILCTFGRLLEKIWNENGDLELAELNTVSAVIQRLISSSQQISELRKQLSSMDGESNLLGEIGGMDDSAGLPMEAIERLEERLKLL